MPEIKKIDKQLMSKIDNIIFDLGGVIVGLDEQLTKDAFNSIIGLSEISGTKYTQYFHDIETEQFQRKHLDMRSVKLQRKMGLKLQVMISLIMRGIK